MTNRYADLLKSEIENNIWTGYVTYYPHKKAYKNLGVLDMKKVWSGVKEVNLYVHIPFCDRKCAYCNLFSTVFPKNSRQKIYEKYVEKVLQEIEFYGKKYRQKYCRKISIFWWWNACCFKHRATRKNCEQVSSNFAKLE